MAWTPATISTPRRAISLHGALTWEPRDANLGAGGGTTQTSAAESPAGHVPAYGTARHGPLSEDAFFLRAGSWRELQHVHAATDTLITRT